MVMFSGLRGAVAFALANIFPDELGHRELFIATTMIIVLLTIFIMGGLTQTALIYLKVPMNVDFGEYVDQVMSPFLFMHHLHVVELGNEERNRLD